MLEKIKNEWVEWTRLTSTTALYDRSLVWLFLSLLPLFLLVPV